ncbi:PspC domain-containing protein [Desmospora profundinema]|uniref:Phage shock protein PspC (Stress-responsive transcriptional regulator) n=1 Tax=Desmospora profundinema TaxID=1571184 RepID=A0ABU1IIP2_9BACL|nr:PspC domain-containing protein [Desmospora profundinema]MDR6224630.1 phage shock protein PspC (stress-responsive transcriptional regulator) [Desmospora profundinema]
MRRLYRSREDRMIAGVCGGIGQTYNIDPALIRILFVVLLIFSGFFPFGLAYLLMIWIVPEER